MTISTGGVPHYDPAGNKATTLNTGLNAKNHSVSILPDGRIMTYVAAAGADNVISANPAYLHSITIGADVASSTIEISDHASDGDGNVKLLWTSSTLMSDLGGAVKLGAQFNTGIAADLTAQTNVTFIWSPM